MVPLSRPAWLTKMSGRFVNIVWPNWQLFFAGLSLLFTLLALVTLLSLISSKGLSYFWPKPISQITFDAPTGNKTVYAYAYTPIEHGDIEESLWLQLDDFHHKKQSAQYYLQKSQVISEEQPTELVRVTLRDSRFLLAKPVFVEALGKQLDISELAIQRKIVSRLQEQKRDIQLGPLASIHSILYDYEQRGVAKGSRTYRIQVESYNELMNDIATIEEIVRQYQLHYQTADGVVKKIPLQDIKKVSRANALSIGTKISHFFDGIAQFLTEDDVHDNRSGGVYPAIFGTVLMVLLMTVIVAPLGIIAAIYLTEYAPNNAVVSVIRIAVNNLAGVPSVVYGVFGLGLFVYHLGGNIDAIFYADKLPTPTFGTPGLLWASLTMALLTLPVVIVATEEGLRRVPQNLRHASYALGATKFETLKKVILPAASSSLMTGIVLAIARGAGEVAPMLLVGAVKYAPVLPIDGDFPFVHLERQFMHLGVLIYDGAFHGQAAQPSATFMFSACLLLLIVVTLLNMVAIYIRAKLQSRYRAQVNV